jgi:hypothetical protein
MKKFIAAIVEGVIVGVGVFVLFRIMDIDVDIVDVIIFAAIITGLTSLASGVSKLIESGGVLYNYEWNYQYGENTILVIASNSEKLYINGNLADEKKGPSKKVELSGRLDTGEKITVTITPETVKKQFTSDKPLRCELLVDGKPLFAIA